MANKSSFMLAVLLIANPFMLLFFQNCSKTPTAFAFRPPSLNIKSTAAAGGTSLTHSQPSRGIASEVKPLEIDTAKLKHDKSRPE